MDLNVNDESSDNHDFTSSSSSSDELEMMAIRAVAIITATTDNFFHVSELDDLKQACIDLTTGVRNLLHTLQATPYLFRTCTNFTYAEFEEFSSVVCPVIQSHARSTGRVSSNAGRPSKLDPHQRLLSFIMFLKHDNISTFDAVQWDWARSSMNDDAIFIASCVNEAAAGEIIWPTTEERRRLAAVIPQFPGCLGFIDGTLCKIRRPWGVSNHKNWYNGRKRMYCFNNTVVIDHSGLFIYIDAGYPGKYHDVNCLRASELNANWRNFFAHEDHYFEYLLGDPGYVGEEMYIMRRIGQQEIHPDTDLSVIAQFNKLHAGYRVRVEWDIGGLKQKWRRLMKRFDSTKPKFPYFFKAGCIMTNFLHRQRLNMEAECIGPQHVNPDEHGWDGDF